VWRARGADIQRQIVITPGLALDPTGDEIIVAARHDARTGKERRLEGAVCRTALFRRGVPVVPVGAPEGEPQHSRVIENSPPPSKRPRRRRRRLGDSRD
jgi:hypothetical protein